jgi:phage gpG-like protein
MFGLTFEGEEALAARLEALPDAVQAALRAKMDALALALAAYVTQDELSGQVLQVRSGALRDSIAAEVTDDGSSVQARVFSRGDVKYAAIQELGGHTPAHDIAPNKARALAFIVGGRRVFARIVHHPGSTIPARPYLRPALTRMWPTIIADLRAVATSALDD